MVVQNNAGRGLHEGTQFVYGIAAKDGLTLATVSRGMVTEPLLNAANFDPTKLTWLGTITSETSVCATWKASPVKTWTTCSSARVQPRRQRGRRRSGTPSR